MQPRPTPVAFRQEFTDTASRLGLALDGPVTDTLSGLVGRVARGGELLMLKLTYETEEHVGARALQWWGGDGAARVVQLDGRAVVMERLGEPLRRLVSDDQVATAVICDVVERLHAHANATEPQGFPSLRQWMASLLTDTDPRFAVARDLAERLLGEDAEPVLLHGDIHHENVLDGGRRGWLAVDPKGVVGPRAFDYCNTFTNWTLEQSIEHFDTRLEAVADRSGVERGRMLQWIVAWSALSGIWHLEDGDEESAAYPHAVMDLALERLG